MLLTLLSAAAIPVLAQPYDGVLTLNEATFLTSHNAHANLAVVRFLTYIIYECICWKIYYISLSYPNLICNVQAEGAWEPLGTNQDGTMLHKQLTVDGVRGLMLDIMLNDDEDEILRLIHGNSFITLDYGGMRSTLDKSLVPFLQDNKDAIISIFFQTEDDNDQTIRSRILDELHDIFDTLTVEGTPLTDMTFKYDDDMWKNHAEWPTLDEIRQSNQRIFVFSDQSEHRDTKYGFMYREDAMQENFWEGIETCTQRYKWGEDRVSFSDNDYWTRLFFMNHFSGFGGPDSLIDTVGVGLIGGGTNG